MISGSAVIVLAALVVALGLAAPTCEHTLTNIVNTYGASGECTAGSPCSLQSAFSKTQTATDSTCINLTAGLTYELNTSVEVRPSVDLWVLGNGATLVGAGSGMEFHDLVHFGDTLKKPTKQDTALFDSIFANSSNASGILNVQSGRLVAFEHLSFTRGLSADYYGGAVSATLNGTLRFENCTFTHNMAIRGGAIYVGRDSEKAEQLVKGTLELIGCTLSNNSARANGGAVDFHSQGSVTVTSSRFTNNKQVASEEVLGRYEGGGMIIRNKNPNSVMVFEDTIFDSNAAAAGGGAIQFDFEWPLYSIGITGCTFMNNEAFGMGDGQGSYRGHGGAIQATFEFLTDDMKPTTKPATAVIEIISCKFKSNMVYMHGGGLSMSRASRFIPRRKHQMSLKLTDTVVDGCLAFEGLAH